MKEKLTQLVTNFANFMGNNPVVQAISHGLMSLLPILMVGAVGALIRQIPIPAVNSVAQSIVNVTNNMLGMYAAFSIAYFYARSKDKDGFAAGFSSLVAFLLVTPMNTEGEGWTAITSLPLDWMGSKGLFSAMIISIISTKIYAWFIDHNITIKMPDSVPSMISNTFRGIFATISIALIFMAISMLMSLTPFGDLHSMIYGIIGAPISKVGSSVWAVMLVYTLSGICWFFGIHGAAVLVALQPIGIANDAANIAATAAGLAPTNIITSNWTNCVGNIGGAGCTLGLVLLCTFMAKSKRYKDFGKLAIVPSCFGINEPVVFGFPMMLNPTTMLPFIFTPVVLIGLSYLLTVIGILPIVNGVGTPVAIPGVMGFLMGGWRMAIWNIVEVVIVTLLYLPSFKKLDAQAYAEEQGTAGTK